MKALGGMWLGVACAVLLLAAPAQAHKLTAKRAEAALQPAAAENTPVAAAKIATLLPGATISDTSVDCQVAKNRHRAICTIDYAIAGASTGSDTVCSQPARVRFRSKRSKELILDVAPGIVCVFVADLP
jgi:hypothetical protein